MPLRKMKATWTESNRATSLGMEHRELVARSDYFWPYLRPLWEPKSYATWVAHFQTIEKYLTMAPDRELIPFEIIITAAEYGRGHLNHDPEYQRHALKHFLCPWRIPHCRCIHCFGPELSSSCCSAEPYCPPRDSQPPVTISSVDFDLPKDMQNPRFLLRDLIAELKLRWGKNREIADSRLEVAVASAIDHTKLAENERTCTLCREDFDDDKLQHMPIAPYERTFPIEGPQNLKTLAKHDTVLGIAYINRCLAADDDTDRIANTQRSPTHFNDWRVLRSGIEFAFKLGIASANLNKQKATRDDCCCGRPVITSCCKQVLGLDCLRKALDPEYLVDKKLALHREPTCPLCRHAHPEPRPSHGECAMLRKFDGSWLHHRYPQQLSFLPPGPPPPSKYTQPLGDLSDAALWPPLQQPSGGFGNFQRMRSALAAVSWNASSVFQK